MQPALLDRWSRQASILHRRDPRAKIAAALVFLVVVATAQPALLPVSAGLFLFLCAGLVVARLPLGGALLRAGIVLPFTLTFAAICWMAGDPWRGVSLILKSYLSALAVLLMVSTTPLPGLLRGFERIGAPRFLLMVSQFLYRYLFVITEQAQHMSKAAACRGGMRFRAAAGALAVLFARSYSQAEDIHRAMLSRGFEGRFHGPEDTRFRAADALFAAAACCAPLLLRLVIERVAA